MARSFRKRNKRNVRSCKVSYKKRSILNRVKKNTGGSKKSKRKATQIGITLGMAAPSIMAGMSSGAEVAEA